VSPFFGWPGYYYPYPYAYSYGYPYSDTYGNTYVQPNAYWYYCQSAGAYYPYVTACPEAWVPVPATR
jgi:hypothetical protein